MYQLLCSHIFYIKCINDWLQKDKNSKRCLSCANIFDKDDFKIIIDPKIFKNN